jgi:hypothetical protein
MEGVGRNAGIRTPKNKGSRMTSDSDSLHRARKALARIERILDRLEGQPEATPFRKGNLAMIRNDLERVAEYGEYATPATRGGAA